MLSCRQANGRQFRPAPNGCTDGGIYAVGSCILTSLGGIQKKTAEHPALIFVYTARLPCCEKKTDVTVNLTKLRLSDVPGKMFIIEYLKILNT